MNHFHTFDSSSLPIIHTDFPLFHHAQTLYPYLHPLNKITDNHWVISPQQQKLLWLPASLLNHFPHHFCLGTIPQQLTHQYDDSNFVYGNNWEQCFKQNNQ
jgi:hypothetical protein